MFNYKKLLLALETELGLKNLSVSVNNETDIIVISDKNLGNVEIRNKIYELGKVSDDEAIAEIEKLKSENPNCTGIAFQVTISESDADKNEHANCLLEIWYDENQLHLCNDVKIKNGNTSNELMFIELVVSQLQYWQ